MQALLQIAAPVAFLPEKIVSIDELAQAERFQRDVAELKSEFGYRQIYVAEQRDHVDLAVAAARKCLKLAGIESRRLSAVILASHFQNAGWERIAQLRIHAELALQSSAVVLDVTTGNCTGLLRALAVACGLMQAHPTWRQVLVIGSDCVDPRFVRRRIDKRVFGDGACALLVTRPDVPAGGLRFLLRTPPAAYADPSFRDISQLDSRREQDMLRAFITGAESVVTQALNEAEISVDALSVVATTNYGTRFWDHVLARPTVPASLRFGETLPTVGHVPTSDVLYNLLAAHKAGRVVNGKSVLLLALGIGISCEAAVLQTCS